MANAARLEGTLTYIQDNPTQHNQHGWVTHNDCGTTGCVAGWAAMLYGAEEGYIHHRDSLGRPTGVFEKEKEDNRIFNAREVAIDVLDLPPHSWDTLFAGGNSRAMLALMVKDLVNSNTVRGDGPWVYRQEIYGDEHQGLTEQYRTEIRDEYSNYMNAEPPEN